MKTAEIPYRQRRNSLILIAVLVFLILAGFAVNKLFFGKEGAKAIIQQNGKIIAELPLSSDTTLETDDTFGGTNTITVKDGIVMVTEANCPDLVCVHTGAISHTGEVIACLPHELIITIREPDAESLDSTTW